MATEGDLKVLVVAPVGRDAHLICDALAASGMEAEAFASLERVVERLRVGAVGALLIAEEVLHVRNVKMLRDQIEGQPPWSDLPILILTIGGSSTSLSRQREQDRLPLDSLTLLERPIRSATLTSSVRSALRSRSKQYQIRDTLEERDRAYAARRLSESRLMTAMETARMGSWELDLNSGELEVSATYRENFDFEPDEPLTHALFLSRVHPEDREALRAKLDAAIEDGKPYSAEYRVLWRDGTVRWMSVNGRLVESISDGPAGSGMSWVRVAGVTLDITERVLSERALRKADKLALVGRLSSSIAHEINNPLESVTNLLYLLAGGELGTAEKEYVALAQRELARVSEITAQTLTFNRQQNTHEEVVIVDILDSVLALYQGRLATSGIVVERRYADRTPVLCFPGEIRQIVTNLVGNAFDAMRTGGTLRVRERFLHHPVTGQAGVSVLVADTGSGMSADVQGRLFEAFHSTKGNNGTGLGLWISRGIAQKHGGSLRFRSSTAAGRSGSVFALFLPLQG